ncbi:DUF6792 domain-containing protein [Virgibacillus kimchii]
MTMYFLENDPFLLRLIHLEYDNLPEEEMKSKIKQFYIEEFGTTLEADIEIFHSSDANTLDGISGYDGTAIYLSNEENRMEELYVISQGTQDLVDWDYNVKSMFAGLDYSQALDTNKFTEEAIIKFGLHSKDDSIPVIGLGHSLANNNNSTAYLAYDTFDFVYSINGAQTNYYQLYRADIEFRREVSREFSLSLTDPDAIYDIDPTKLQAFAETHYADKAENIHQTISLDDPLYAVSGQRGFFTIGEVNYLETNPDYPGLREIMDDIPDEVVRDFQELAIQYTVSSEKGGTDQFIYDVLGADMEFVNTLLEIDGVGSGVHTYFTHQEELDTLIRNLNDNVPELMSKVTTITSNADLIFGRLEEAGYISTQQKDVLITEITAIETELLGIQQALESNVTIRDTGNFFAQIGGDIGSIIRLLEHASALQDSAGALGQKEFMDILQMIGASHGIPEVLDAITGGRKSYMGTDMILTATQGKKEIRVNMSAALELYQKGLGKLAEKETAITRLANAVDREIQQAYNEEKRKVIAKINEMEASPLMYQFRLMLHLGTYSVLNPHRIESIRVHEEIYPLEQADLDHEFNSFRHALEREQKHIENYRQAVELLFDEDEKVSRQFDLIRGV